MGDQFDVMVPVRVDLSGGWTDVNPYCTDFGGEVVNFTINKFVKANINLSGEVSYNFDIPIGSGLGTSGSVNVARIALLRKSENLSLSEIAEAAYQAEIKSGNKCGRQDQCGSSSNRRKGSRMWCDCKTRKLGKVTSNNLIHVIIHRTN